VSDERTGSVRARARVVGELCDELIEEIATGPDAALVSVHRKMSTLEYEWRFDERPAAADRYAHYLEELYERAIARGLCASDWLDEPSRRFVRDRCPNCDGTAIDSNANSSDIACGCFTARPTRFERLLRMLALPPSMIVAQEHIARERWPSCVGVVYVTRFESVEYVVRAAPNESHWLARPDPAMIGVRWPRLVRE
jgi:hypothetical protein